MEAEYLDIDKSTQDFINSNNLFYEQGDPFEDFVISNIHGIHTFGKPSTSVNVKKVKSDLALMYPGEVVFEANYNFDEVGRRVTTLTEGNKDKVALFFGDSQMFGEGVNDNETLAYYFEHFNNTYRAYNYGFLGHGPGQMLYTVSTDDFKEQFNERKGKAFFLYRDDAIKTSVGEVPWGEGYPKYSLINNKVECVGTFGGNDYQPNSMYLPSMYTVHDYSITVGIFKEIQSNLPKGIELTVVCIPLTFSNYKIQELFRVKDINFINLYHSDLEFHTGNKARFLDGVHTKYSNEFLAKRLTHHLNNNIKNYYLPLTEYRTKEEVLDRLELESIFIPVMVDFPEDDAGVIISNIIKMYTGSIKLFSSELLQVLRKKHKFKLDTISTGNLDEYISSINSNRYKEIALFEYKTLTSYLNNISYGK